MITAGSVRGNWRVVDARRRSRGRTTRGARRLAAARAERVTNSHSARPSAWKTSGALVQGVVRPGAAAARAAGPSRPWPSWASPGSGDRPRTTPGLVLAEQTRKPSGASAGDPGTAPSGVAPGCRRRRGPGSRGRPTAPPATGRRRRRYRDAVVGAGRHCARAGSPPPDASAPTTVEPMSTHIGAAPGRHRPAGPVPRRPAACEVDRGDVPRRRTLLQRGPGMFGYTGTWRATGSRSRARAWASRPGDLRDTSCSASTT